MNAILKAAAEAGLSRRAILRAMGGSASASSSAPTSCPPGPPPRRRMPPPEPASIPSCASRPTATITVVVKHLDLGQGTTTGFATLVAEELDADLSKVEDRVRPLDPKVYAMPPSAAAQGTGGSTSMAASFAVYRRRVRGPRDASGGGAKALNVPADAITITSAR